MFELFFVIELPGKQVREFFPDEFVSKQQCEESGVEYVRGLMDEVIAKYPDLKGFDIECLSNSEPKSKV